MKVGNNYSGARWAFSQRTSDTPSPFRFSRLISGGPGRYEVWIRATGKFIGHVEKDAGGRDGGAMTAWRAITREGRWIGIRFMSRRAAAQALFRALASSDGEASRGA